MLPTRRDSRRSVTWLLAHADDRGRLALDQSQEAIARSIGTTRVSVNRALGQFARRGLIEVKDGEIAVRDRAHLRSISEGVSASSLVVSCPHRHQPLEAIFTRSGTIV